MATTRVFYVYSLLLVSGASSLGDWTYDNSETWGGLCANGKAQSPVDIETLNEVTRRVEPFNFVQYDTLRASTVYNDGHSLVVKAKDRSGSAVSAGGLKGYYQLDHIHFHWHSEHTFNGERMPLEVHLVHYNKTFPNIAEAKPYPNGLAVIAILFQEGDDDNDHIEPILDTIEKSGEATVMFAPGLLLPKLNHVFYRYHGSLTTPPCYQSVIWTIMKETVPISTIQVERFRSIPLKHGPHRRNYRPTQPINDRHMELLSSKTSSFHPVFGYSTAIILTTCNVLYLVYSSNRT